MFFAQASQIILQRSRVTVWPRHHRLCSSTEESAGASTLLLCRLPLVGFSLQVHRDNDNSYFVGP